MQAKPSAPAAERNAAAILDVLRHELGNATSVLEIGSGTGQHAVTFAAALDYLVWQTSDLDQNHAGITAWIADAKLDNVRKPLSLDVLTAGPIGTGHDAVYSANTAHIMSLVAVEKMFALVSAALAPGGVFCLYGPFRENGDFNTQSNADFDRSLRQQDAAMGIRNLEDLNRFAEAGAMRLSRRYAMPANNMLVVWKKMTNGASDDDA